MRSVFSDVICNTAVLAMRLSLSCYNKGYLLAYLFI